MRLPVALCPFGGKIRQQNNGRQLCQTDIGQDPAQIQEYSVFNKAEKTVRSDRLTLGGVVLQFDRAEIEVLALCAWCKDLPVNGSRNIPPQILDDLRALGLIRQSRNKLGYRCTPEGIMLLRRADMAYPQDKTYRTDRGALVRRWQTAEITSFFWRYGAKVFTEAPPAEKQSDVFLPSFALRRQKHANILGGTRLTGFYYAERTVFIPYFIAAEHKGLYPDAEQRTFRAETLLCGRSPHILYTGDGDLTEIIRTVSLRKELPEKATTVNYIEAMDRFHCPLAIMPLSEDGMRQLRILSVPDHCQRLAQNLLGTAYLPPVSPPFDGRSKTENILIGIDCNILRFEKAVRSEKRTRLFVLPFQAEAAQQITAGTHTECFVLDLQETEAFLGLDKDLPRIDRTPFQTGKGEYIYVPPLGKTQSSGR